MPQSIETTLAERGARYGSFIGHATITQALKCVMQGRGPFDDEQAAALGDKWDSLAPDQRECLEMVAHKIGRILNGDPNYLDSWVDLVGYSQLVVNRLEADQASKVVEPPKRGRPAKPVVK